MQASCSICSENYNLISDLRTSYCGHVFHYECIWSWLERSQSCPQCRKPITPFNIHKVFLNFENIEGTYHLIRNCEAEKLRKQLEIEQKENIKLMNEVRIAQEKIEEMEVFILSLRSLQTDTARLDAELLNEQLQNAILDNSSLENKLEEYKNEIAELKIKNLSLTNAEKEILDLQNQLKLMIIDIPDTIDINIQENNSSPQYKINKKNNRSEKTQFKKQFNNLKKSTFQNKKEPNTSTNSNNILFGIDSQEEGRIIDNLLTQVQMNNEEIIKEIGNLIKGINIEDKKK